MANLSTAAFIHVQQNIPSKSLLTRAQVIHDHTARAPNAISLQPRHVSISNDIAYLQLEYPTKSSPTSTNTIVQSSHSHTGSVNIVV